MGDPNIERLEAEADYSALEMRIASQAQESRRALDLLTRGLARREMTPATKAIFDEHKRRRADGEPMLTREEWEKRRSPHDSPKEK